MSNEVKILENGLPQVNRYITTIDASGKSVLAESITPSTVWQKIGSIANFFLAYTTRAFPVPIDDTKDVERYAEDLKSPPGLSISSGTVVRYVDMAPNTLSPMHQTVSMDYGIVLEGTIELVLDSGETKIMRRGDICIQRGTNHAWRNVTENNGWGRMVYVLTAAKADGLKENLNGMEDVRASD